MKRTPKAETMLLELERTLEKLEENYRMAAMNLKWLRDRVEIDDLTKLLRKNAFLARFNGLLAAAQTRGREVHLLMLDIDHFKKVNDTYGHQAGDTVLERVSALIQACLRPGDLAGRYGGEELIVAVEADTQQAGSVAESLRRAVEEHSLAESGVRVTISAGLASSRQFGYRPDQLIRRADEALYAAKNGGRNKVVRAARVTKVA